MASLLLLADDQVSGRDVGDKLSEQSFVFKVGLFDDRQCRVAGAHRSCKNASAVSANLPAIDEYRSAVQAAAWRPALEDEAVKLAELLWF